MLEERVEARLPGVLRDGLLYPQRGFPAEELEDGYVVVEPGFFVRQSPADPGFFDAGQAGERLADELAGLRPGRAETDALGEAERVPERRADRLVDGTLHAVPEVHLCQVAVVHVAGEEGYGGGGRFVRAFARGDGPQQFHEVTEGILEGGPVLQVEDLADELADLRRLTAPNALADGFVPRLEVVQAGHQEDREGGAEEEVVEISYRLVFDPGPLLGVEHGAMVFREHPSGARVHHDQAHVSEVAVVAPAGARDLPVGPVGELAQHAGCIFRLLHLREQLVLLELLRGEVAEMLVDPVRHERSDDALLPPGLGSHLAHPCPRGVPVVVDVVVVEDHDRGHGREQPPYGRVLPRVPVQARVLLEVRHLLARRLVRVAPRADEVASAPGDLVGVDLVAEEQEGVGPALPRLAAHPEGEDVEGVALEPVPARAAPFDLAALQRVRRLLRDRDAAGAEGEGEVAVRFYGPDRGGGEIVARLRPDYLTVEPDRILV